MSILTTNGVNQKKAGMTKSEVYSYYGKFNSKIVRRVMNDIISSNREISLEEAGNERVLFDSEVYAMKDRFS